MAKSSFSKSVSGEVYGGKSKRLKQVWALKNTSDVVKLTHCKHIFGYLLLEMSRLF